MNIKWNAQEYEDKFQFVHKYGEDVTQLINADAGAFVVDLGCGNGALSKILSQKGYRVLGIDASADMIETAKKIIRISISKWQMPQSFNCRKKQMLYFPMRYFIGLMLANRKS